MFHVKHLERAGLIFIDVVLCVDVEGSAFCGKKHLRNIAHGQWCVKRGQSLCVSVDTKGLSPFDTP